MNCNNYNNGFDIDNDYADSIEEEPVKEKTNFVQQVFEWLEVLSTAVIAVVVIFSVFFRTATIKGDSMQRTLQPDDRVIISNLGYKPKYGDIVVISRNQENTIESVATSKEPIIKRVIAVGGQTVDIDFDEGVVYVDGKPLDEPYTNTPTNLSYTDGVHFPVYVPDGYIFVLGDNRNDSLDSRSARIGDGGLIDERYVLGRAVLRIFPFSKTKNLTFKK